MWTLAVGCPLWPGNVYIYREIGNQFTMQQKTSDLGHGSIPPTVLDGNGMAIATMKQTAYLYIEMNGVWTEMAALENPVGTGYWYGRRVALSGDKLFVASSNNVYFYTVGECMPPQ